MITITADDIGAVFSIDMAVKELIDSKIINSISVFVTGKNNLDWINDYVGKIKIGLHLTFSFGRPISKIYNSNLIDENGSFKMPQKPEKADSQTIKRNIDEYIKHFELSERNILIEECSSQFYRFKELFGINPDFINVHHDLDKSKILRDILEEYFKPYPTREIKLIHKNYEYSYIYRFLSPEDSYEKSVCIVQQLIDKGLNIDKKHSSHDVEIVFHPAYLSKELFNFSSYAEMRELELKILLSDKITKLLFK